MRPVDKWPTFIATPGGARMDQWDRGITIVAVVLWLAFLGWALVYLIVDHPW
jgi:hypothetical protein